MCFIDTRIGRLIQVQNWPQITALNGKVSLPVDTCRVAITISIIDTTGSLGTYCTIFDILDNKNSMFLSATNGPFHMKLSDYGSYIQRRLDIVNAISATGVLNVVTYTLPEQYLAMNPDDLISKYGKQGF